MNRRNWQRLKRTSKVDIRRRTHIFSLKEAWVARRQREEADYAEDAVVDEAMACQTLADAEQFTDRLERFLRDVGAL